jgi:YYY domain-containing protein
VIEAFVVWLLLGVIGVLALPFTAFLFARLPGRGLALSKPVGLLLVAYPAWLLASLHVVGYSRWVAVLSLAAFAAVGLVLWIRRPPLRRGRGADLKLWLAAEILFTVAFVGWTILHSFSPDVWQTEKPMDMAIVNAVNRSESFPPHDPWFSGESLNYYYYGHYLVAFLIRTLGLSPWVGYNLAVPLFYALTLTSVFAVASSLYLAAQRHGNAPKVSPILPGIAAAGFAMLVGNLAGGVQFLDHTGRIATYDWWAPSRVIAGTANEFPFFSFLLADLHAHQMATPFAMVALAYALQLALRGPRLPRRRREPRDWALPAVELLLASLVVGSLYAINTADYPPAVAFGGAALLVWALVSPRRRLLPAAAWTGCWVAASLLLYLPFLLHFSATTHGIGLVTDHEPFSTFLGDYSRIYGLPLWVLIAVFASRLRVPARYVVWGAALAMFVLVLLSPAPLAGLALAFSLAAFALYAVFESGPPRAPYRFLWLLIAAALLLVAVGEFVYVRDAFDGTASYRFNTIFKAGYQAWFLFAIAAGCVLFWSARWLGRRVRIVWLTGLGALVLLAAVYPVLGSYSRSGTFSRSATLNGIAWLENGAPGDAAAIKWMRSNVRGAPTVLEAVGPDFDADGRGRVSTFTGLPTVIAWGGHEVQWGHDPGSRGEDVKTIYSTADMVEARRLLDRYGVRYVFVGSLEQKDFSKAALAKFAKLGSVAFEDDGTVVYRVGA